MLFVNSTSNCLISIHALREEGDTKRASAAVIKGQFLSTPSARRATLRQAVAVQQYYISIHALREEGDCNTYGDQTVQPISIHALREEGDSSPSRTSTTAVVFLSTPSARRATPYT